jgi:hypothetical protein
MRTHAITYKVTLLIATGILAGCGPRPSNAAPSTSPSSAVTVAALVSLGEQVFPQITPAQASAKDLRAGYYADCSILGAGSFSDYSRCPLTTRLKARLRQAPLSLCRGCGPSGGSPTRKISTIPTATGGIIHVQLFNGAQKLDLIAVKVNGGLLVDDERCAGDDPATSEYVNPIGPAWGCGGP